MKANAQETEWNEYYSRLAAFRKKFSHLRLPIENIQFRKIAEWLELQKNRHSSLHSEQIRKLLELGITFGPRDTLWYQHFFELDDYVRCQGKFPERRSPLARWLENQRSRKKAHALSSHRIRLLDSLGVVWDIERKTFSERLSELKAFKARHGHCHVPVDCGEFPGLGGYVASCLRTNRESRNPEEIRQLDALGFIWDPQEALWQQRFLELKNFLQEFGVYPSRVTNPSLSSWVHSQRTKPPLPERIRQLKEIGFEWVNRRENQWMARYLELKRFSKQFGHCRVPEHIDEYRHLWSWLYLQKTKSKSIPPQRKRLLDQLGVDWIITPRPTRKDRMKELNAFFRQHGHCNASISENRALARWLTNLRSRKNQLSGEFRQRLEKMGMDWSPQISVWNQRYENAVAYKAQLGDLDINLLQKANRGPLGWLNAQRKRWGRLTAEQKRRVVALVPSICSPHAAFF